MHLRDSLLHVRDVITKVLDDGGPATFAGASLSIFIMATSLFGDSGQATKEVFLLIGAMMFVLAFVEWALGRRFSEHNKAEKREREAVVASQHETYRTILSVALEPLRAEMNRMVMVFDGASATNDRHYREFQRLTEAVEKMQVAMDKMTSLNLEDRVTVLERALKMRP